MTLGAIDHRLWCSCMLESLVNGADAEKAYADFGISVFDSWYHGRVSAITDWQLQQNLLQLSEGG